MSAEYAPPYNISCRGKLRYKSWTAANKAANKSRKPKNRRHRRRKTSQKHENGAKGFYSCPYCQGYHLFTAT